MLQLYHRRELVRGALRTRTHPALYVRNRGQLENDSLEEDDSTSNHEKHERLLEFVNPVVDGLLILLDVCA